MKDNKNRQIRSIREFTPFLFLLILMTLPGYSQNKKVELLGAKALYGTVYKGQPVRKLVGDVVFRQGNIMMYCDSSYQYEKNSDMEAFSNIRIIKSDSQSISGGQHMYYTAETRVAKITGPEVHLISGSLNLYTTVLDYNLGTDISNYYNRGTVIDKENKLISDIGTYFRRQNNFIFIRKVVFNDKKHTIYTDTLEYNTETQIVKFRGPTTIVGPDGIMKADQGEYDSKAKTSNFRGRARIVYSGFILNADKVYYDQFSQVGKAAGNVEIFSIKDSVTIFGDYANYWGTTGRSKVFPSALMQSVSGGDTLFLTSDTLYAVNDTVKKEKKVYAYHHVKVFNKNMQAICDSLIYNQIDSSLTFFKDPVLWNTKNQMRGDTVIVYTKNKKIEKILLNNKAFAISLDTIANHNQVKGKKMTAFFKENKVNKIDVKGNSESIYYALQGDTVASGLNRVESEDMSVRFAMQKINTIAFYKKPKAVFIPPHEIKEEDKRLKGFKWRDGERPTKEAVLGKYLKKSTTTKQKKKK